jgi:hypothetical protein
MDLALDDTHDLFVTNQDLTMTTPDNEVIQDLKIRLQFILNEWFLDNNAGVPYPQIVFEKSTNVSTVYSIFRNEIKNTDNVKEIVTLTLTPLANSKIMNVNFSVIQDNGTKISQTLELGI